MRYESGLAAVALLLLSSACSGPGAAERSSSSAGELTSPATLTFSAAWTQVASQPLVAGQPVQLFYDPARLPECSGNLPDSGGYTGGPGWSITGFYSIGGVSFGSFPVAGAAFNGAPNPPVLTPTLAGDLQLWFQCGSVWGNSGWDSAYGANYHFPVAAPSSAPGWVGGAASLIDRATCTSSSGAPRPCYADSVSLDAGFTFDTWARQRAAITQAYFDVWKQGVTDFANPDLWRELDVELHFRIKGQPTFTTQYVSFSAYEGNNARYAIDLRALDPLQPPGGSALTNVGQCPTFATTTSADGQFIQAAFELYFTVNGVGVLASGGGPFEGTYSNYKGLYAICP